jgi:rod shape-determining protein MreD
LARRTLVTAAIIVFAAALQFSALRWVRVAGTEPDLLLIVTVVIGLVSGPRAGMAAGFSAGVIEGALLGRWIGVYAAAKTISGYLAGEVGGRLFVENLLVMMGVAAAMTLVHEGIVGLLLPATGLGVWKTLAAGFLQAAYNGAAALVVGLCLRRIRSLLPAEEVRA